MFIDVGSSRSLAMNDTTIVSNPLLVSETEQFSKILENYQLSGGLVDPFEVVENFTSAAAQRALAVGQYLGDSAQEHSYSQDDFERWDMEAKLWHLVHILYSFRLSDLPQSAKPGEFCSASTLRDYYLDQHPQTKELLLIAQWLQYNSQDVSVESKKVQNSKWAHTKIAIENEALNQLTSKNQPIHYVDELDVDAPLRSHKHISPKDRESDDEYFGKIYRLLVSGDIQAAIDFASETGNYTMALILIGAAQDYIDPVMDNALVDAMDEDAIDEPSGIRHKFMWFQTVNKLAQEQNIGPKERLIYTFLCGGSLTENIKEAGSNWEECLLLYINQIFTHHVRLLFESILPESEEEHLLSVAFLTPQNNSINDVLNTLLKSQATEKESQNPLRVIMGSVMINQLNLFLANTVAANKREIFEDAQILRVLAHLAVINVMLNMNDNSKTTTKIITRYISTLSRYDLVPVYLAFIPDEKDLRECYSIFLSQITDSAERARQLEMCKKLGVMSSAEVESDASSVTEDMGGDYENKINNVLKRTVERVMIETEPFYKSPEPLTEVSLTVHPKDITMYTSVGWFYENKMYEDAISASITVVRRFLLTGRLASIMAFAEERSFKQLIKDYDFELQMKSISENNTLSRITDADKDELLQYIPLVECLNLMQQWRSFTGGWTTVPEKVWKSADVGKSIEKTLTSVRQFISNWFKQQIASCDDPERVEMFKQFRYTYVPYFVIELLQVLKEARFNDWHYIKSAFSIVNEVANDKNNDFLNCFIACGKLEEFVTLAGKLAAVASERGIKGIFS